MCYSNIPHFTIDSSSTSSSDNNDEPEILSDSTGFNDDYNFDYLSEESSYSDVDSGYDDDDTDNEELYDEIHENDYEHFYAEKEEGMNYIGIAHASEENNCLLMSNTVSTSTFFLTPYHTIVRYLYLYGLVRIKHPTIDIMRLHITPDEAYSVVLKTYWIRLIQRHWRKIVATRKEIIRRRCSLSYRRQYEVSGQYPEDAANMPSLHGLLSEYTLTPTTSSLIECHQIQKLIQINE